MRYMKVFNESLFSLKPGGTIGVKTGATHMEIVCVNIVHISMSHYKTYCKDLVLFPFKI